MMGGHVKSPGQRPFEAVGFAADDGGSKALGCEDRTNEQAHASCGREKPTGFYRARTFAAENAGKFFRAGVKDDF